ncbi:uncharacterized protein LOC124920916 isoform X1 [Impatiens glandulifera]|uniref:uncharacterized protein LOC124920916 isoform X1 n=1 Tax=Impatiens glandulifera TaxID=253017 RepID=UPI001FB086A5|nr:uncharacterized protein LOC124920916 isoform X1 [Impatiens glandulifera]
MAKEDILLENRLQDVQWLCSLSESELDMLISLKTLLLKRADVIGHPDLASKCNIKMLRVLAFILMEHLRDNLADSSLIPALDKYLDTSNLSKSILDQQFEDLSIHDLRKYIDSSKRKRIMETLFEDHQAPTQKKKMNNAETSTQTIID